MEGDNVAALLQIDFHSKYSLEHLFVHPGRDRSTSPLPTRATCGHTLHCLEQSASICEQQSMKRNLCTGEKSLHLKLAEHKVPRCYEEDRCGRKKVPGLEMNADSKSACW
jgi:hypothetical protein